MKRNSCIIFMPIIFSMSCNFGICYASFDKVSIYENKTGKTVTGTVKSADIPIFLKPTLLKSFKNFTSTDRVGKLTIEIITKPSAIDAEKFRDEIAAIDSKNVEISHGEVLRQNDDLKVEFGGGVAYFDWPYRINDDDKDLVQTDKIVDGKRIRQITFTIGSGSVNMDLYANYETTLYEVNIMFSSFLSLPSGWYKGNTHVHAKTPSGGEQEMTPFEAAYGVEGCDEDDPGEEGYAELEYDFIYITRHNKLEDGTDESEKCNTNFQLFKGEEIGLTGEDPKDPHIIGLNISSEIDPATGGWRIDRYYDNCEEVTNQDTGNNPTDSILNHPSYNRVSNNVLMVDPVYSAWHLEIHNGKSSDSKNNDYKDRWKYALKRNRYYSGVAADDAHNHNHIGKAWVVVRASSLDNDSITQAFWDSFVDPTLYYSSTGVVIEDYIYSETPNKLRVEVYTTDNNADYVQFKGEQGGTYDGDLLTVNDGDAADACAQSGLICAEYTIPGDVDWVRPVVGDSNQQTGWKAWLQPWHEDYMY